MRKTWALFGLIAVVTVVTAIAHFADAPDVFTFVSATIALAGLAWIVSFSTEQVGERFSAPVTGLLQSTLGNLPEFFIVIFALSAGEVVVAQTSIIGSIFANALLVLGLVIVAGCRRSSDGVMRFHPRLPKDNAILMMLASFLIVLLGISIASGDRASHHVEAISIVGALALLVTYGVWLVDYLRDGASREPSHGTPRISMRTAIALLAVAGVGAALVADWFIAALTPAMEQLGVPKAFAGLVIVAIAGNAVENTAGVVLASKGQVGPRDLGRQELGGPDHGVPLPGARARVAGLPGPPHIRARPGIHRGPAADRDRPWPHHRRRRGNDVRGHRSCELLRDSGRGGVLRVTRSRGARHRAAPLSDSASLLAAGWPQLRDDLWDAGEFRVESSWRTSERLSCVVRTTP